jgi:hypothetical protein
MSKSRGEDELGKCRIPKIVPHHNVAFVLLFALNGKDLGKGNYLYCVLIRFIYSDLTELSQITPFQEQTLNIRVVHGAVRVPLIIALRPSPNAITKKKSIEANWKMMGPSSDQRIMHGQIFATAASLSFRQRHSNDISTPRTRVAHKWAKAPRLFKSR